MAFTAAGIFMLLTFPVTQAMYRAPLPIMGMKDRFSQMPEMAKVRKMGAPFSTMAAKSRGWP